ncbi:hypothetical protein P8C59_008048 [Phyllachora maydis]|uniref:DUF7514 domain-containing protein n=1 Tax=Phyllachora maydis TaxID=1825666 RepID=A0AAD9ME65_9PEZI|nr:hypothetical protein P8C59_008048 [Phyllachora maydis]
MATATTTATADATATEGPRQTPDAHVYYGYLFHKTGAAQTQPTPVLDALLRAIGIFIINEIGDKNIRALTPAKLAAFYKAVQGNYDSLFVDVPHQSISYIWQVTGCQHTLQPGDDDFNPPSVPALTLKGFVRWESIELLLGPQEHVPFLQYAVRHWNLKNPDDGTPFPPDLPSEAFPSEPDVDVDKWHRECANTLRKQTTTAQEIYTHSRGGKSGRGRRCGFDEG